MSLAIYAAPFDDINNNDNNDNLLNKKRQTHQHNKTQKIYSKEMFTNSNSSNSSNFNKDKVNSVLEEIHNNTEETDINSNIPNFNPPPKPKSSGVERTSTNEAMQNMTNQNNMNMYNILGKSPQPNYDENNLDLNNYRMNYGDNKSVDDYYKKMLPNIQGVPQRNPTNKQYYSQNYYNEPMSSGNSQQDLLLQKLNYMINLLEEKQDERTNNVTEEVVLYSFLGIFIIFVIDSFARVGKYVR
ncbi:MAG: hypothetical protein K9G11_04630 [Rickettsiaceae bacterium]|nr:hypothetical protein [Rickettsiaceae bacterium]